MRRTSCIFLVCAAMSFPLRAKTKDPSNQEQFLIILEPKWEDLDKNKKNKILFEDKWFLAGDIIFKKKTPEAISLQEIHLLWKGKELKNIIGSLYEKSGQIDFMPIEKYLICDSKWKSSEQKLILRFPEPRSLYAVNTLSLVITAPKEAVNILKNGYFELEASTLPTQYQEYAQENNLKLALGK